MMMLFQFLFRFLNVKFSNNKYNVVFFFLILTITNFNFEIVLFLFEIMFVLPSETTLSL